MILVDTSVWVRGLAGRQPYKDDLNKILREHRVTAHELVYGELLIGDNGGRVKMLSDYAALVFAKTVPHREVVDMVLARRLYGRRLSWIDAHLLAAALAERVQLYTADGPLIETAGECGVLYTPA